MPNPGDFVDYATVPASEPAPPDDRETMSLGDYCAYGTVLTGETPIEPAEMYGQLAQTPLPFGPAAAQAYTAQSEKVTATDNQAVSPEESDGSDQGYEP